MNAKNKISGTTKFKMVGFNILLFGLLFGAITLNKEYFRPYFSDSALAKILTGSFPNFAAAYIISLFAVNAVLRIRPRSGKMIVYISSIIVFTILAIEEIKPMWGASTYYDLYDILASGLGSVLSILTYEGINHQHNKKIKKSEKDN